MSDTEKGVCSEHKELDLADSSGDEQPATESEVTLKATRGIESTLADMLRSFEETSNWRFQRHFGRHC